MRLYLIIFILVCTFLQDAFTLEQSSKKHKSDHNTDAEIITDPEELSEEKIQELEKEVIRLLDSKAFLHAYDLIKKYNLNPNLSTKDDVNLMSFALQLNRSDIVNFIIQHPLFNPNLGRIIYIATKYNRTEILDSILQHPQFDPNFTSQFLTFPPILNALKSNIPELAVRIMKHPKFDPSIFDKQGQNILAQALVIKKVDLAFEIVQHPSFMRKDESKKIKILKTFAICSPEIHSIQKFKDLSLIDEAMIQKNIGAYLNYLGNLLIWQNDALVFFRNNPFPTNYFKMPFNNTTQNVTYTLTLMHLLVLRNDTEIKNWDIKEFWNLKSLPSIYLPGFINSLTQSRDLALKVGRPFALESGFQKLQQLDLKQVIAKYGENLSFPQYLEVIGFGSSDFTQNLYLINPFSELSPTQAREKEIKDFDMMEAFLVPHIDFKGNLKDREIEENNTCSICSAEGDVILFKNPCGNHLDETSGKFCSECLFGIAKTTEEYCLEKGAPCPINNCPHEMLPIFLSAANLPGLKMFLKKSAIDNKTIVNIMKLCVKRKALQNPNNKFCLTDGCNNYFFVDPKESKWVKCDLCNKESLLHGNEVELTPNSDDKAFQKYLEENPGAKKCPKCSIYISKNDGCEHMTCKKCKYHFHWESLKPYYVQCPHCKHKNSYVVHVKPDANNRTGYFSSNTVDIVQCENKDCKKEFKWE